MPLPTPTPGDLARPEKGFDPGQERPDAATWRTASVARTACREVSDPAELELVFRIRRQVFVDEQGLFSGSDRDHHDDEPATRYLLAFHGDVPAGTVRLYPHRGRVWKGDRLAVLPEFRRVHLGAPLVRLAVATAGAAGGTRMVAHVQIRNVVFFERLGWRRDGDPQPYVGVTHQQMVIDLVRDSSNGIRDR